eukprot:7753221-Lingulodinium_polyedra.AAC.1
MPDAEDVLEALERDMPQPRTTYLLIRAWLQVAGDFTIHVPAQVEVASCTSSKVTPITPQLVLGRPLVQLAPGGEPEKAGTLTRAPLRPGSRREMLQWRSAGPRQRSASPSELCLGAVPVRAQGAALRCG